MTSLYIGSTEPFCGKSALALGIGLNARERGWGVGYMKPVSLLLEGARSAAIDQDASFASQLFDLQESLSLIAPVTLSRADLDRILEGELETDYQQLLTDAYNRFAPGKQLMLAEGGANLREGHTIGLPAQVVVKLLNARAVVVVPHNEAGVITDDALAAQAALGEAMLGVLINRVPRYRMRFVEENVRPFLEKQGVKVYGVIPEERVLQAVSVREIAERLDGEILCAEEAADELVENLMVGAMSVDSALSYFRRLPNKAVITGGDRPDVQLAALETSTKAVILTGNLQPSPLIVSRAAEIGVPMILVKQDTLSTVEAISSFFGRTRLHQPRKLERFRELMAERVDLESLYADLGVG
ncbi:MAG: phosphotransacetylase family protein [Anaerolineae bacterium]|jgi:BioD-like phosphotransacetylase family protein